MYELKNELGHFEKRLKDNADIEHNVHAPGDSSDEDRPMTENEQLKDKVRVLIEKLYKSEKTIEEQKSLIESIGAGNGPVRTDAKDKKIIELAKKNKDLNVKIENVKNKAARAMEEVKRLQAMGVNVHASVLNDNTTIYNEDLS